MILRLTNGYDTVLGAFASVAPARQAAAPALARALKAPPPLAGLERPNSAPATGGEGPLEEPTLGRCSDMY